MHVMRFCVVMTFVVGIACFLSFFANQKSSKKNSLTDKKSTSQVWKKEFEEKISEKKPPEWMLKQITEDLAPFASSGITSEMLDAAMQQNDLLVRFQIVDNQLAIVNNPILSPRFEFITHALQALCEIAPLPNSDFIISLADTRDAVPSSIPVLSISSSTNSDDLSDVYYYLYLTLLEYARLQK